MLPGIVLSALLLINGISGDASFKHECARDCVHPSSNSSGNSLTCVYNMTMEWYISLSRACYDCPRNVTDCYREDCISGDGNRRPVMTANRALPGPSIQVCKGDTVQVYVTNNLDNGEGVTIHWHGIHQRNTPYMDGVPMLTQCPIPHGTTFRYSFVASEPGTHYWHSHMGRQRTEGLFGSLIVRDADDVNRHLYDFDKPEHVITIIDWLPYTGMHEFLVHMYYSFYENSNYTILVNGKGHRYDKSFPLEIFQVEQGRRYRFRLVHGGHQVCSVKMSVEGHNLTVIASDGAPVTPTEVQSMIISNGERYDFILETNQAVDSYFIRFRGLEMCRNIINRNAFAVLRYQGSSAEPVEREDDSTVRGKLLNPRYLPSSKPDHRITTHGVNNDVRLMDLNDTSEEQFTYLNDEVDHRFYIKTDFYLRDDDRVHKPAYPVSAFDYFKKKWIPQVDDITFILPPFPPLTQPEHITEDTFCNTSSSKNCLTEFCKCPYVLKVDLDSVVELVVLDEGFAGHNHGHPFHLHGQYFHVLAEEYLSNRTTVEELKRMDDEGKIQRKLSRAVRKDTVFVPVRGYVVLRMKMDNPGFWFFHCHVDSHLELGMALVIQVGEPKDFSKPPGNFPRCGSWPIDFRDETPLTTSTAKDESYVASGNKPSSSYGKQASPFLLLMNSLNVLLLIVFSLGM